MEPADIDWKTVVSLPIRDDAYERFNAPMWADLSRPDPPTLDDDVAWFCRPDCRHPRTAEDFQRATPSPKAKLVRSSSETLPLGERNANSQRHGGYLKRRGGIPSMLSSSSLRAASPKAKPSPKKLREDAENRDPNLSATPPPPARPKAAVKSSAEKRREDDESKKAPPRLKSTLSARNLFAGKDLLGQISEFCQELKKMALKKDRASSAREEEMKILEKEEVVVEEKNLDSKRKDGSLKKVGRLAVKTGAEGENNKKIDDVNSSVAREAVRSCPPTPQRFPSPSTRRLKSTKATNNSPLKPPKSSSREKGILQEVDQIRDERRALAAKDEENRASASPCTTEGSSLDLFWFLKPCTYI